MQITTETFTRRQALAGIGAGASLLVLLGVMPPAPDPITAPANLVWHFRLASLGGNLLLWAVLAFSFGMLASAKQRERAHELTSS